MERFGGWYWYSASERQPIDPQRNGKWMYFFDDQSVAMSICEKAIASKTCSSCKCTDMETRGVSTGVICFYLNGDDVAAHKRVIEFMLSNALIQKTKAGRLYNISFKFDTQTRAGEYGREFNGALKLSDFVNLDTGEWIRD